MQFNGGDRGDRLTIKLGTPPLISVVIPAYNEEQFLPSCLLSLKRQDYPGGFEIIVVDNNSTDRTAQIAASFGAQVILETKKGPAAARQRGANAARGDIIAFIDADTCAPINWLSRINRHFQQHPHTVVVSGPYAFQDTNILNRGGSYLLNFVFISLDHYFRKVCRKGGALWGANFAVRRISFEKVGGFDTSIPFYGEDYELSLRLKDVGKSDLMHFLFVTTSARRVRYLGIVTQYWNWIINYFSVLFQHHPIAKKMEDLPSRCWYRLTNRFSKSVWLTFLLSFLSLLLIILFWALIDESWVIWAGIGLFLAILVAFLIYHGVNPGSRWYGEVFSRGITEVRVVALTFDDGPQPFSTSQVLEILARNGVRATFFVTGEHALLYPKLCQQIVREGHIIGSHAMRHQRSLCLRRKSTIDREITAAEKIITEITGVTPLFFRPPYGFRSPIMMEVLRNHHYKVITWDNMTDDWQAQKSADKILQAIMLKVQPGGIIVLHDGRSHNLNYDRSEMLQALPQIIHHLNDSGYKLVTIPEIIRQPDIS